MIETFIGLPGIHVEDPERLATALGWAGAGAGAGMDFVDTMHLASARGCTAFVSVDRALAKTATGLATVTVVAP